MLCVIYTRISSDDEQTRLGVARQERDCRALAERRGWTVAKVYSDNDISAADPKVTRPAYRQLLADMEAGHIEALVVWDLDRLHRRPVELEHFFEVWDASGQPELANVGGDIDLATPQGRMVARLKGAVGAYEVEQLTRRVRAKHLELARQGKVAGGGYRPFGYERDNITIRPDEAEVVREMVDRLLSGESLRSACRDLDVRGIRTSAGKAFQPYSLRRLVTSARIAGHREHPQAGRVKAEWEPIIDLPTLEQVRAVLNDPTRRTWRPGPTPYTLQGGLAVCGECGTRLFSQSQRGQIRGYRCVKRTGQPGCGQVTMRAHLLEDWVEKQFLAALTDADFVASQARIAASTVDVSKVVDQITQDEQRLEANALAFADGDISEIEYRAASKKLTSRLAESRRRLAEWDARDLPVPGLDQWSTSPAEVKRRIYGRYIDAVKVFRATPPVNQFNPDRVQIVWRS